MALVRSAAGKGRELQERSSILPPLADCQADHCATELNLVAGLDAQPSRVARWHAQAAAGPQDIRRVAAGFVEQVIGARVCVELEARVRAADGFGHAVPRVEKRDMIPAHA